MLKSLKAALESCPLSGLDAKRLNKYADERRAGGAGGVTVGIHLTYIDGVRKTASAIWKIPVDHTPVSGARARLAHLGVSTKSRERTRRPALDEIERLCDRFRANGTW